MKKRAFTMVELIFVIVILGILAAVAVPRLNASREDAEITKFAANLATIYKDVQTYYLANGTVLTDETAIRGSKEYADISKITNVPLSYYNGYWWFFQIGGADCLGLIIRALDEGQFIELYRSSSAEQANPTCQKMWEVFANKPELGELVKGQVSSSSETIGNLAHSGTYVFRPIFRHKDGVNFD